MTKDTVITLDVWNTLHFSKYFKYILLFARRMVAYNKSTDRSVSTV